MKSASFVKIRRRNRQNHIQKKPVRKKQTSKTSKSNSKCVIIQGIVEGFWEYNLQPWDTAAGNIIVTEADGTVSNENGNQYNFDKCIVVSNNKVHKDFLKIINES